jgi:hypothetical protein
VLPLVLGLSSLEQVAPRRDIWATTQKSTTFPLGHTAPHPKLNAVIKGIGQALRAHLATEADGLHPILGGTLDEEGVWISGAASSLGGPSGINRH